jgi:hypothetical protein
MSGNEKGEITCKNALKLYSKNPYRKRSTCRVTAKTPNFELLAERTAAMSCAEPNQLVLMDGFPNHGQ